jgi:glycosyltransferase involved in cell wall biosynthesis
MGGTENQVLNLGLALDPFNFDLQLACFTRWGQFLKDVETRGIPLIQYGIGKLYHWKTFAKQLRFAGDVRRNRTQIVHTYGFYPNVFGIPAARLGNVPVVVASIRDTGPYLTPMKKRFQRAVCRLSDCILVNAEAVRKWLISEGYPADKIAVIRNGVDLSGFGKRADGSRLRQELGLPPQGPLVAVFSRLERLKGIEYFLNAAAVVTDRFPEARFLIVGGGFIKRNGRIVPEMDYRTELEKHAARLGLDRKVVFTGFRMDVPELLSEVTVSVLPSLSEGLPNVLLESMAAAVPVVATRVGGNPEAVEDGETGLLVPPRDPEALVRAISRFLEDPDLAFRFGQAGKERVIAHFSLGRMVQETERLYHRLLKGVRNHL